MPSMWAMKSAVVTGFVTWAGCTIRSSAISITASGRPLSSTIDARDAGNVIRASCCWLTFAASELASTTWS